MSQLILNRWQGLTAGLRVDRVLLSLAAVLGLIAVLVPEQLPVTLAFTGDSILTVLPFFVASVLAAASLRAAAADRLVARVFSGPVLLMIGMAAAFGALSPFCSCGVIPIIAALLSLGVPLAPVMAFWIASPLMSPDLFLLAVGTLGWPLAVTLVGTALSMGLLGGLATEGLRRVGLLSNPLRPGVGDGGCAGSVVRTTNGTQWAFWRDAERRRVFLKVAGQNALLLGKWLLLAFVLESLLVAWLPAERIAPLLGEGAAWALPLAVLAGVPAYLNGYAALPLIGGLMQVGMAPGAAVAFLTAGAVTSLPAAMAVWPLVRVPVFLLYVGIALGGALLVGLGAQTLLG